MASYRDELLRAAGAYRDEPETVVRALDVAVQAAFMGGVNTKMLPGVNLTTGEIEQFAIMAGNRRNPMAITAEKIVDGIQADRHYAESTCPEIKLRGQWVLRITPTQLFSTVSDIVKKNRRDERAKISAIQNIVHQNALVVSRPQRPVERGGLHAGRALGAANRGSRAPSVDELLMEARRNRRRSW